MDKYKGEEEMLKVSLLNKYNLNNTNNMMKTVTDWNNVNEP